MGFVKDAIDKAPENVFSTVHNFHLIKVGLFLNCK